MTQDYIILLQLASGSYKRVVLPARSFAEAAEDALPVFGKEGDTLVGIALAGKGKLTGSDPVPTIIGE